MTLADALTKSDNAELTVDQVALAAGLGIDTVLPVHGEAAVSGGENRVEPLRQARRAVESHIRQIAVRRGPASVPPSRLEMLPSI